jgi:hypothetical protein
MWKLIALGYGYLGTAWKWGTVRVEVKNTLFHLERMGTKMTNWERVLVRVFFMCVCVCFGVFFAFCEWVLRFVGVFGFGREVRVDFRVLHPTGEEEE